MPFYFLLIKDMASWSQSVGSALPKHFKVNQPALYKTTTDIRTQILQFAASLNPLNTTFSWMIEHFHGKLSYSVDQEVKACCLPDKPPPMGLVLR
jgi:hypothetical protein